MEIKTRVPGVVEVMNVKVGDQVKAKDVLMKLEAMKMATSILAPIDGEVTDINVEVGDHVRGGAVLLTIE